ncbi:MAG TPA: HAMP domain-containing sensor histidine kinase [Pseudonocardiaceae bacterium]|jgi:signal transduction histidine kinase
MTSRRPTLTIRAHLALVYGITFALAATVLSVGVYLLMSTVFVHAAMAPAGPTPTAAALTHLPTAPDTVGGQGTDATSSLILTAGIALALGVLVASVLGWLVAGRMLAPIRRITAIARETAARNLHARVALAGPRDEITELADTFDGMLARLEQTFQAQRRFAANASHELLTPLTTSRAILEVAAASPDECDVRVLTEQLLAVNDHSEHLVDTLLDLTRAEHGVVEASPTDLAMVVQKALAEIQVEAQQHDLTIEVDAVPTLMDGDPALLERLVVNLLRNAVRHNESGGRVLLRVARDEDGPKLIVSNTGQDVPPDRLDTLFEPFVRAASRVRGGHGLGMAIIRAVTTAHHGTVTAAANSGGGLTVTIGFPQPESTKCRRNAGSD